jgi:transposase
MLEPDQQAEILALHFGHKKGIRAIARELGLTRKTVRGVVLRRAVALRARRSPRKSILDPFKPRILNLLELDPKISSTVVFQRIRDDGYLGSYSRVKDWVGGQRAIPHRAREAFLSLEFQPGECAQVDWGEFGDPFHTGIKIHCFVMVLCFSRLLYLEFTRSERFEEFIRCHENAFRFFGGVPRECWYDNLTSAVTDRMGGLIRFNARFMAYMGHHAIRPHACNPARGNEKGRVEDGVKYVRNNFWPARSFKDFDDICAQSIAWRDGYANKREHASTGKIPVLHFSSEEKAALRPLNSAPYDCDELFSRVVPPQFHVIYETNRYSVPWTLVGMTVTVRVNAKEITIFYHDRFVTKHDRSYKKGMAFTKPEHVKGLLERKPGASREGWQIASVKSLGPRMMDYVDLLRSGHRSLRTEVSRILALSTIYGEAEVYEAAVGLLEAGIVGVENLELSLKKRFHPSQRSPEPLKFRNEKLNRTVPTVDLRRYDALLFGSTIHDASTEGVTHGDNDQ